FDRQEHHVRVADGGHVVGALGVRDEDLLSALDSNPALPHGGQVRAPGDEHHLLPTPGQVRSQVGADCTRPDYGELQADGASAAATPRRWTLPVAVRGISSTMNTRLGTLKSASRSRQ